MNQVIAGLATSGFPFQTAVSSAIRATKLFIVDEEVAWSDDTNSTRFIDVVASCQGVRICVECKALRNERLVFLLPHDTREPMTAKLKAVLLTRVDDSTRRPIVAYGESETHPNTHESSFCVVVGSGEKGGRIIEREVQPLVLGTEAYAIDRIREYSQPTTQICIPVLLTTASLYVASYDANSVSLADGVYRAREEELEAVEIIRFTKEFTSSGRESTRKRTVIVAQAKTIETLFRYLSAAAVTPGWQGIFDPTSGVGRYKP